MAKLSVTDILGLLGYFATLFGGKKLKSLAEGVAALLSTYDSIGSVRVRLRDAAAAGEDLLLTSTEVQQLVTLGKLVSDLRTRIG